ncbi:MAG: diaminopimelate epimerase [Deltaproteobacteria bacterium]|nr:diaminopimelate epimerase [Deltaproteobacteria bacterium]
MPFTKMHGLGNDFVVVDCRSQEWGAWPELSRRLADRRFGVGCDQVLLLYPSAVADFRMDIYNADGSRVEMCGNGVRCFAKHLRDKGITSAGQIRVETLAGIVVPRFAGSLVEVDMGEPVFEGRRIPVAADGFVREHALELADRSVAVTCVSMGNPHAVVFVDQAEGFPVEAVGPQLETHPFFPNRVNVEFVQVLSDRELRMRVWERGAGVTLACGTGACAAAVVSAWTGRTGRTARVVLDGGPLEIRWDETSGRVFMTGPAETVFEGEYLA